MGGKCTEQAAAVNETNRHQMLILLQELSRGWIFVGVRSGRELPIGRKAEHRWKLKDVARQLPKEERAQNAETVADGDRGCFLLWNTTTEPEDRKVEEAAIVI